MIEQPWFYHVNSIAYRNIGWYGGLAVSQDSSKPIKESGNFYLAPFTLFRRFLPQREPLVFLWEMLMLPVLWCEVPLERSCWNGIPTLQAIRCILSFRMMKKECHAEFLSKGVSSNHFVTDLKVGRLTPSLDAALAMVAPVVYKVCWMSSCSTASRECVSVNSEYPMVRESRSISPEVLRMSSAIATPCLMRFSHSLTLPGQW